MLQNTKVIVGSNQLLLTPLFLPFQEFINVQLFPKLKDKVQDILTKKYPEYFECREYVDFVTCYAKRDPQPISKAKEIVDRLLKSNDKLPPFWKEFLLESKKPKKRQRKKTKKIF